MNSKLITASLLVAALAGPSFGQTLRIVDWNIEADISGYTTPRPNFNTVLQGIGEQSLGGVTQPLDILALEETTSNTTTVQPILNMLNGDYSGANYQMSTVQMGQNGGNTSGNGPNAIVYNANSVTLLQSVGVGTPGGSSNGEYRQVARYKFQPVNGSSPFYVYVSHMKSGATSSDLSSQNKEAQIIANDANTLPAGSSILYTGDFNVDPGEATQVFNILTGTGAGKGNAVDPLNLSIQVGTWTESSTNLRYRDDYQLMTQPVYNGTGAINYVSGTYEAFGNNGTTPANGTVYSGSNTAFNNNLTGPIGGSQILAALTTASDHLPNIADYTYTPIPEPMTMTMLGLFTSGLLLSRRSRQA